MQRSKLISYMYVVNIINYAQPNHKDTGILLLILFFLFQYAAGVVTYPFVLASHMMIVNHVG